MRTFLCGQTHRGLTAELAFTGTTNAFYEVKLGLKVVTFRLYLCLWMIVKTKITIST
jgi:hypothetical protein